MCKENFCVICKPDFSRPVGHFTWEIPPPPKNYNDMLRRAAVEYESNRKRHCDKYWPPRRWGAEYSLLLASRACDVCPDDLAFYVNSDDYQNGRKDN